MKIAIIIVNFNSAVDTLEAVESAEKSLLPKDFERKIYVVENGSRDQEGEWSKLQVLAKYTGVELVKSKKNLGFTGGNNLAIKKGKEWEADYFLLLNADTKVKEDFLIELIRPFTTPLLGRRLKNVVGIASPKIFFYPGYEFHKDWYKKEDLGKVIWYGGGEIDWENVVGKHVSVDQVDKTKVVGSETKDRNQEKGKRKWEETDFATGCCMLIKREVIEKIGGLDDRYFFSWEDTDYSVRARLAGFRVVYVPEAVIWHKNANTSGGAGSAIQDFYQTRNRLIFAFKYARPKIKILLLWTLLWTAIVKGDWNRLKAIGSALAS